jgi:hypothetical protein
MALACWQTEKFQRMQQLKILWLDMPKGSAIKGDNGLSHHTLQLSKLKYVAQLLWRWPGAFRSLISFCSSEYLLVHPAIGNLLSILMII